MNVGIMVFKCVGESSQSTQTACYLDALLSPSSPRTAINLLTSPFEDTNEEHPRAHVAPARVSRAAMSAARAPFEGTSIERTSRGHLSRAPPRRLGVELAVRRELQVCDIRRKERRGGLACWYGLILIPTFGKLLFNFYKKSWEGVLLRE